MIARRTSARTPRKAQTIFRHAIGVIVVGGFVAVRIAAKVKRMAA